MRGLNGVSADDAAGPPTRLGGVVPVTITARAYLVPATRSYVAGYPPAVANERVNVVSVELNNVVSLAVRATKVAVVSFVVYNPIRARVRPLDAVPPVHIVIDDTVIFLCAVNWCR
jgi:hypothetical protein